jgi:cytochrome c
MRALLIVLLAFTAGPAMAASGQEAFNDECASCHSLGPASGASGPSLKGVVWRRIAAAPDFAYSRALKDAVGSWSPASLDSYLKDTQAFAPGTSMFFAIDDRAQRQAIIAYLKTVR